MLPDAELAELAEDIAANGLLNPIVLFDGKVLDGRNRHAACQRAGVEPQFVEWVSNGLSPIKWVLSQNLVRRHLEAGQRAAVAIEARPLLAADARRNQLAHLKQGQESPRSCNIAQTEVRPIDSAGEVANLCGVSRRYVCAAQKIKDTDEDVFQEVKAGKLSLPEAQRQLGFKQSTKAMVSSQSNEWYTPERYIEAARSVLGSVDLDPASCESANAVVKANAYYTMEEDGLNKPWRGKVWLNPPYGDLGPKFVAKLIHEYESGNVTEAVLLVNSHCTDTKWFEPLFGYPVCFTNHRSKFWNDAGEGGNPTHGSAIVYFGAKPEIFAETFAQFGSIVHSYPSRQRLSLAA
jgi:ParB family chromosome partitioning protein